ncbi:MAG: hypothetical protein R3C99_24650 [Pirellulaceae bacterium]
MIAGIPGVAVNDIVGLAAGWLIGKWTEYAERRSQRPTKNLAEQALTVRRRSSSAVLPTA